MNVLQHLLVLLVRSYRWVISPAKTVVFGPGGRCRHSPSCSEYALVALQRHGALRGGWLALARLARCHPWGTCGHDPVPESFQFSVFNFRTSTDAAAGAGCGYQQRGPVRGLATPVGASDRTRTGRMPARLGRGLLPGSRRLQS